MYNPKEREPQTLAEAVVYATYWYADSGWHAFVNGWAYGNNIPAKDLVEFKSRGREAMIAWADIKIRKG